MTSMNSLSLSGNLTRDFELNKGVAKCGIAINTWDKKTFFVDLIAFRQTAEYIAKGKYKKGDLVVVSGELNVNKYNDKVYVQCVVKDIERFSKKKADDDVEIVEENVVSFSDPKENDVSDQELASADLINVDDDDLPF